MPIISETFQHEPADSVHGQLQRGRGTGYLSALKLPREEAHRILIDCITRDPRFDTQCESRSEFYAHLARELDLPLGELTKHLTEQDDTDSSTSNTWLTISTLGDLARLGSCDAQKILTDYVGWGHWWIGAILELIRAENPEWKQLDKVVCDRFQGTEELLANGLEECESTEEPWVTWFETNPLIREAVIELQRREEVKDAKRQRRDAATTSLQSLLKYASESNRVFHTIRARRMATSADVPMLLDHIDINCPETTAVALAGLSRIAPSYLFETIFEFWSSHPEMPLFLESFCASVLCEMDPEQVLPIARSNFCHEDDRNRRLAERLMLAHATDADIPLLRKAARQCMNEPVKHYWRLSSITRTLGEFEGYGFMPELHEAIVQMPCAIGRGAAAEAMASTCPESFRKQTAFECLWDADYTAKLLGIEFADATDPLARKQLLAISKDILEEEETKTAARERLEANNE